MTAYGVDGELFTVADNRPPWVWLTEEAVEDCGVVITVPGCEERSITCWPDGIRMIVGWLGDANISDDGRDIVAPGISFWPVMLPWFSRTWAPGVLDSMNLWPPISSVRWGVDVLAGRVWETDGDAELTTVFCGVTAEMRWRRPSGKRTTCWPATSNYCRLVCSLAKIQWASEQFLNGTSAQLGYTVPFMSVHAGKHVTEDKLKTDTLQKLNTTQKKQTTQKTQQNNTTGSLV